MSLTLNIVTHWSDGKRIHVVASLVASGNYPAGGDTIPLNDPLIKSGTAPVWIQAQGLGGFNYVGVPGVQLSTPPNAKLRAFNDVTGVEVPAGAYPAGVIANPIQMYAVFHKF